MMNISSEVIISIIRLFKVQFVTYSSVSLCCEVCPGFMMTGAPPLCCLGHSSVSDSMFQFPVSLSSASPVEVSPLSVPIVSPLALHFVSVVVHLVQCQVYMPEVPVSVSELCFLFYFESPWSSMLCYLVVVSSLCAVCSLFLILATVLLTLYSVPKFLSLLVLCPESSCPHSRLRTQPVLPRRGKGTQQPNKAPLL